MDSSPILDSVRSLPPHVRLLVWPEAVAPDRRAGLGLVQACPQAPTPWSDLTVDRLRAMSFSSAEAWPKAVHELPEVREPLSVIAILALWDEVVRKVGIYTGNIYLASETAVSHLLTIGGVAPPQDVVSLLDWLTAFELLYRFPVAYKFRHGYGSERQCRLNGWGRLAYRMARCAEVDLPFDELERALVSHALTYSETYRAVVGAALRAEDGHDSSVWQLANELPIGVLV